MTGTPRLLDPFGRVSLPEAFTREARVAMLAEGFEDLLAGRLPRPVVRSFIASGGLAWLSAGGNLERDYWKVRAARGSHLTPQALARLMDDERQAAEITKDSPKDQPDEDQ